jgi:hypothetical protein
MAGAVAGGKTTMAPPSEIEIVTPMPMIQKAIAVLA